MDELIYNYICWLRNLVGDDPSDSSFNTLFEVAWSMYFDYSIPNDYNRADDGIQLRSRYTRETSISLPDLGDCTMLEFLVGLAIRWNDTMYDNTHPDCVPEYFWNLIKNLELDTNTDDFILEENAVDDIVAGFTILNDRLYGYDGSGGGLFPLQNPHEDQTKVEIWYQMMAYLTENWWQWYT